MPRVVGASGYARRLVSPGRRGGNPTGLDMSRAAVADRRRRFAEARDAGADVWDAAMTVGVDPSSTGRLYERWYQAAKAGSL